MNKEAGRYEVGELVLVNGEPCEVTNVWKRGAMYDHLTVKHPDGTHSSAGGLLDRVTTK